jgi:hypothetical protein
VTRHGFGGAQFAAGHHDPPEIDLDVFMPTGPMAVDGGVATDDNGPAMQMASRTGR